MRRDGPASVGTTYAIGQKPSSLLVLLSLAAAPAAAATLTSAPFGTLSNGTAISRYTMATPGGVGVTFMSYGAAFTDVVAPDRAGRPAHVVLGFPTLRQYETIGVADELYFGAVLGRYANWIRDGRFSLDGQSYQLTLSDPPNTIHGGKLGFDRRVWTVRPLAASGTSVAAALTYTSPDGEEGFPSKLSVTLTYTLDDDGALTLHYQATTDGPTVVNLSNHMNFNLAGAGSPGGVLQQVLTVHANQFLPVDRSQIPRGAAASVAGTPFDFRRPTAIGAHIHDRDDQLAIAGGYDQYWILNKTGDQAVPQLAVHAVDPASGRTLDCYTTQPGVQIYTAGWFDGSVTGTGGAYGKFAAFTLETQHAPDAPNHPAYPSTVLRPGEVFDSTTILRFGVER